MTPVQWNEILRGPWPVILTTVEREVRAWFTSVHTTPRVALSTRELCEALYPEKLARGENLEVRKKIMTALLKLSGFQLSDCNEAGEPVMRRGKMVRPRMWHAPTRKMPPLRSAEQERAAIVRFLNAYGAAAWAERIELEQHHAVDQTVGQHMDVSSEPLGAPEVPVAPHGPGQPADAPVGGSDPDVAVPLDKRSLEVETRGTISIGDRVITPEGPGVVESIKASIDLVTVKLDGTGSRYSFRSRAINRADTKSIPNPT